MGRTILPPFPGSPQATRSGMASGRDGVGLLFRPQLLQHLVADIQLTGHVYQRRIC